MYLLGAEVEIEWVLGVTASTILYTDLDLLIIAPNGVTTYFDSPIEEANFAAPSPTVEGAASYFITPQLEGLYKIRLVVGTSTEYNIIDKVEMFIFDSSLVVNPLLSLQHLNAVEVQDEGEVITEEVKKINFIGNGVFVEEGLPNQVLVTIPGSISVEDEGDELTPTAIKLNFVGKGVTVTKTAPGEVMITNPIPLVIEDEGNGISVSVTKINMIGLGLIALETAPGEVTLATAPDERSLTQPGPLKLFTGTVRWYPVRTIQISLISLNAGISPTGKSILVEVYKNGVSILDTALEITAGSNVGTPAVPSDGELTPDDYITISVMQVGNAVSGSDLFVNFKYN